MLWGSDSAGCDLTLWGKVSNMYNNFFLLKEEPSGDAVSMWCVKSYSSYQLNSWVGVDKKATTAMQTNKGWNTSKQKYMTVEFFGKWGLVAHLELSITSFLFFNSPIYGGRLHERGWPIYPVWFRPRQLFSLALHVHDASNPGLVNRIKIEHFQLS